MDVAVTDIPARFGMLLSRSWGTKLGGVLKFGFYLCYHTNFWWRIKKDVQRNEIC